MKNEGSTDYDLLQSALRPPIVGQKNLPFKAKLNNIKEKYININSSDLPDWIEIEHSDYIKVR